MTSQEFWADVEDAPNYQVSTHGKVRNVRTGRVLKPQLIGPEGKQYYGVTLYIRNKWRVVKIHRLVADHFIERIPQGMTVNHLDGDKLHNVYTNLEIATYSRNNQHAFDMGLKLPTRAYKSVRCLETGETFKSLIDAAESIGVTPQAINGQLRGRSKTVKGLTFEYNLRDEA